jgi:hypothetical protein
VTPRPSVSFEWVLPVLRRAHSKNVRASNDRGKRESALGIRFCKGAAGQAGACSSTRAPATGFPSPFSTGLLNRAQDANTDESLTASLPAFTRKGPCNGSLWWSGKSPVGNSNDERTRLVELLDTEGSRDVGLTTYGGLSGAVSVAD